MSIANWFKETSGGRPTRRHPALWDAAPEALESRSLLSTFTVGTVLASAPITKATAPLVVAPPAPVPVSPGASVGPGPVLTSLTPTFTWQAASGATSYLINIHNITANKYFTQTLGGSVTSFTPPAGVLTQGAQYNWHLYSQNSGGSGMSALLYFQTASLAPSAPVVLSPGSTTGPGPVLTSLTPTFTWQAVPGATGYLINIHNITNNTYFTQQISGGTTTSFTPPAGTLTQGAQYNWHLYSQNSYGSGMSVLLYFQTASLAPAAPVVLSPGSSTGPGPVLTSLTPTFTWQAVPGATSYLINIHNITNNTYFTQTLGGSLTSFTPPAGVLTPGAQYNWHLYSQNSYGSGMSALLYFQTQTATNPLTPPVLISPGSTTGSGPMLTSLTPTFTWQAVPGATSYLINIHNITNNTYFTQTLGGSVTSFTPPAGTLSPGAQYNWHLYAQNAAGSSMSALLYFQTQSVTLAPPVVLSPGTSTGPGPVLTSLTPTFTWQAVPGATSYYISIHNTTNNTYFTQTVGGSLTSFTVPKGILIAGAQYNWHMYAQSGNATSISALLYFRT